MNQLKSALTKGIKYLLFATAFVPLLYSSKFFFPHITQKLFFVRGVILVSLALALILSLLQLITTNYHLITD
ncbi:MAG: hypothetical protein AAB884_02575, partial [Patescibacteria group bacterium]